MEAFEKDGMRVEFGGSDEAVVENAQYECIYAMGEERERKQLWSGHGRENV
jgi:hypothetical protein